MGVTRGEAWLTAWSGSYALRRLHVLSWLILDSRVVSGQVWRNRLFLQAFPGGHDRCGIFGKSRLISSASVLYRVCKTPESNMSLNLMAAPATRAFLQHHFIVVLWHLFTSDKVIPIPAERHRDQVSLVFLTGSWRMRFPVAANMALQSAGIVGGTPVGKSWLGSRCTCVS